MDEHSFLPNFDDNDVVEFNENNIVRIGKLREALKPIFSNKLESQITG